MPPTKLAIWQFLSIFVFLTLDLIECKSFFGIGTRIFNDQLIVKDILQSRQVGVDEGQEVGFNYAIPQPITYIEISSEQNILAEVNFSYQNDLVKGTIIANNNINDTKASEIMEPFEVEIFIYGLNDTVLNVNPSYILNRDQQFQGILEPDDSGEFDLEFDSNEVEDSFMGNGSEEVALDMEGDMEYADDFADADKIIHLGERQQDDYLLYQTYQTSQESASEPTNHTVIFYYIDSNFITYVRFIVFDHTIDKSLDDYQPPVAEYTHFSPNSLKATIFDGNCTSLFVQMFIYGYQPNDLPINYKPFLRSSIEIPTESPLTPLQRLRMLMNAKSQQSNDDSDEINFETGERNELLEKSTRLMSNHFVSDEINFETGERNEILSNNTALDASSRCHLNGFTVFNLIFIYFLIHEH